MEQKYAVIIETTITIPGDERSKTHPGHGYPEHTEKNIVFKEFRNEETLLRWIKYEEEKTQKRKYKIIKYEELSSKITITLVK